MEHTYPTSVRKFAIKSRHAVFLLALGAVCVALPSNAADSLHVTVQVSNYSGYQVSCFGMKDGWIDLTVTGGEAPYTFKWSNGSGAEDQTGLAPGYYKVDVMDQAEQLRTLELTLEQPLPMKLDVDLYEYPNGYNVSCYDCFNGNAAVVMLGGAAPFTVTWSDGPVGAVRYNLGPKDYKITVADANGCEGANTTIILRGPDRSDWSMGGNANTTPGPHFIGTPDNKDVVFKSNGQERLRLKSNGEIGLWGADTTFGPLYRDLDGTLKIGGGPDLPVLDRCSPLVYTPFWKTTGNFLAPCPGDPLPKLGTLNDANLRIVTNGQTRIFINADGRVGVGTTPPQGPPGNYRLFVENGIATRDVLVKHGTWPDFVFQPGHALMPLPELRAYLQANRHLPGLPSAAQVEARQGVELGDMQRKLVQVVEEQALYILQLEEQQARLVRRLDALEHAQH
ncbi:MAG: SprB repeat-containing protein [Flavobacteriales bacterium]|nr:SprB repeat-containing protein [Flavobacteriales bacterium]